MQRRSAVPATSLSILSFVWLRLRPWLGHPTHTHEGRPHLADCAVHKSAIHARSCAFVPCTHGCAKRAGRLWIRVGHRAHIVVFCAVAAAARRRNRARCVVGVRSRRPRRTGCDVTSCAAASLLRGAVLLDCERADGEVPSANLRIPASVIAVCAAAHREKRGVNLAAVERLYVVACAGRLGVGVPGVFGEAVLAANGGVRRRRGDRAAFAAVAALAALATLAGSAQRDLALRNSKHGIAAQNARHLRQLRSAALRLLDLARRAASCNAR